MPTKDVKLFLHGFQYLEICFVIHNFPLPLVAQEKPFPRKVICSPKRQLPKLSPIHTLPLHTNNSLCVYIFLNSELVNQGMKVEVNRAFKSYSFFQLRKKHKKRQALDKFSLNLQHKCPEVPQPPISKSTSLFSVAHF